jgi:hypothetical protein
MRRILLALVAMVIPVTVLTVGISGTAGAAGGKIDCTTITGNASSTIVASGCTGGNTGGSSEPLEATALATGGTITWVSGSTTTVGAPELTSTAATKCPGYVKGAATNPSAEKFVADITADTGDGVLLPATSSGEVCIAASGAITALKPMDTKWHSSTIKCSGVNGTATGTITVSGCTGGDTGGGSEAMSATTLASGGTIDWLSGGSSTIGTPTLKTASATKCPGYVKKAASEPTAESFTAVVTADTGDGLALPGKATGEVCISTGGSITALKALAAS